MSRYRVKKLLRLNSVSKDDVCMEVYLLRKPSPRPGYTCIAGFEDISVSNQCLVRHTKYGRYEKEEKESSS